MIKDDEWGAVAYLSHSTYGKNGQIRINNYYNSATLTGCGADTDDKAESTTCDIPYASTTNYPQSTTGNITGIFDMSGGAREYTMGVLKASDGKPYSGTCVYTNNFNLNSGYNGLLGKTDGNASCNTEITKLTTGKDFPGAKYYQLYETTSYNTACSGGVCYGKALGETRGWYSDYQDFVTATRPWFVRGGCCFDRADAGAFAVSNFHGGYGTISFWVSVPR